MSEAAVGQAAKRLLEYVPERLEELERIQAEVDAHRAEQKRIDDKIQEAEIALMRRQAELAKPDRSHALAEAALRGDDPPKEPKDPPGVAPQELQDTIRGLTAMREVPAKQIEKARALLRERCIAAFREAAERAAADLVAAARRVEALHAEIGAAQRLVESMGSGHGAGIVVGADWFNLAIPSSEQIATLGPATKMNFFKPMLVGGYPEGLHNAATAAFQAARSEVTGRLGGRWPLDGRA